MIRLLSNNVIFGNFEPVIERGQVIKAIKNVWHREGSRKQRNGVTMKLGHVFQFRGGESTRE